MKRILFGILTGVTTIQPLALHAHDSERTEKPNIIFFLVDDLNYQSLGYVGNKIVQTPNIDRLANNGCIFNNAFVTTSISMASRASLFTGKYMCNHGVTQYLTPMPLKKTKEVYPKVLKNNGYESAFTGKFGFKIENGASPSGWFDYYRPVDRPPMIWTDSTGVERHTTGVITDNALEFIKTRNRNKPFCLSISYHASHAEDNDHTPGRGHYPYMKERSDYYKNDVIPIPELMNDSVFGLLPDFLKKSMNRERYFWRWDTPEKYQENVKSYYRMITDIDESVKKVCSLLKKEGIDKNTVIIFMSDNGYFMGERGLAGKWIHFEESLRVPMFIYDPRVSNKNRHISSDEMVLNVDIPSTILQFAGVETPDSYQGKSLVNIVNGVRDDNFREEFYCEHGSTVKSIPRWRGVRTDRYVYAHYYDNNYEYLHDLKTDPKELKNFANDNRYTSVINELRTKTKNYFKKYSSDKNDTENKHVASIKNGKILNPILMGDYPDPTILKTDSCWYMTHSSFEYTPGLLIWKSKDLLSWTPVNHALNKYVGSVYAPDMVEVDGHYYIYFAAKKTEGPGFDNWVITTDNIEGEWNDPVKIKLNKIDPGHIKDMSGNRYLYFANGTRIGLDNSGTKTVGRLEKVYDGWEIPKNWDIEGFCLEGPKLFHRDGYYYMISAQGGTAGPYGGHMAVCARTKSLDEPWENSPYNPLLRTFDKSDRWWSVGHATVFEGRNGKWFVVYHGYENNNYPLGRQTLMQPIEWTDDGWPVLDVNTPLSPDDFNIKTDDTETFKLSSLIESQKLSSNWRFFKEEDYNSRYNIAGDSLVLYSKGSSLSDSSPMLLSTLNNDYSLEIGMRIEGNVTAGLTMYYNEIYNCALAFSQKGITRYKYGRPESYIKINANANEIRLRMNKCDNIISWYYSTDGKKWVKYPNTVEVSGYHHNVAGGFLSLLPGVFVFGDGKVTLYDFVYKGLDI